MTILRRKVSTPWMIPACSALLAALLGLLFHAYGYDDPFITYRYAAQLAAGQGFVYNPGERVLSTTTPLWTLILAPPRWLGLDVPSVSNALGCLSLATGGWALWRLFTAWRCPAAAGVAVLVFTLFPLLASTLGAETAFYIALILLGLLAYTTERPFLAAALFALATLTRADGVLAVAVVGLDLLLRRRPIPWRAALLYGLLIAPWFVFAWWYFGAPLPVTLAAKQQQALIPGSERFGQGFLNLVVAYWQRPLYRLHLALSILGLVYGLLRQRRALLIPAWSAVYFVAYVVLGVTRYHWYYAPLVAGWVALIALGVEATAHWFQHHYGVYSMLTVVGLLLVALLLPQSLDLTQLSRTGDPRLPLYRAVGLWLKQHTPPQASVGALEVGIIGYYAERPMVDFAGLIQPETVRQFSPTRGYDQAAQWAVERFQPDYLALRQGHFAALTQQQNDAVCHIVQTFDDPAYPYPMQIFQCDR